jgi:hypothetical protein
MFKYSALLPVLLSSVLTSACVSPAEDVEATEDDLIEAKHLGMTDLTVLYPLPTANDLTSLDELMSPSSEGSRGELFGSDVFDQLNALKLPLWDRNTGTTTKQSIFRYWGQKPYSWLRIVAIRLDPCFGESTNLGAASCQPMIRMVAQTVDPDRPTSVTPNALHLFYSISRAEFAKVAKGMLALRIKAKLPLQKGFTDPPSPAPPTLQVGYGVHPTLVKEGLGGEYNHGLRDLMLAYAGRENLVQVAVLTQDDGGAWWSPNHNDVVNRTNSWIFGRFDVRQSKIYGQTAPALSSGMQTITLRGYEERLQPGSRVVSIAPAPRNNESYLERFGTAREHMLDATTEARVGQAAFNFLNPTKHTARTTDCVTCHLADQAAPPGPDWRLFTNPMAYKSNTYRLNSSAKGAGPFRMIGWVPNDGYYGGAAGTVISSRVVNETALLLDYVNKSVMK